MWASSITLPYSRFQIGHYNECIKFEFNDVLLTTNNDSE